MTNRSFLPADAEESDHRILCAVAAAFCFAGFHLIGHCFRIGRGSRRLPFLPMHLPLCWWVCWPGPAAAWCRRPEPLVSSALSACPPPCAAQHDRRLAGYDLQPVCWRQEDAGAVQGPASQMRPDLQGRCLLASVYLVGFNALPVSLIGPHCRRAARTGAPVGAHSSDPLQDRKADGRQ